ncbi:M20 family metallopeptidase [Planctomicrobium sp. SH661]|uniref:M20 family metallopeptidase n=1 Tax=Planctomicrobium sp. SH661 TaxID=3448124 RepID=UPI003F5B9834
MTTQLEGHLKAPVKRVGSFPVDPIEILCELIEVPSVNPMGQGVSGPTYFEGEMTQWLARYFEALNVPYECQEVLPGRCNVVARFDSPGAKHTILMDAHQDTVPTEGMTIDPFRAVRQDGRVYGRGACDVKGGLAAMLAAFARIVQERPKGAANILMVCTCDEEFAASGVRHLANQWRQPEVAGSLTSRRPDICLVAEPTDLNVIVAHRGVVRWKLKVTGTACHSSRPEEGVNAIYKMGRVLKCLEDYADEISTASQRHPLCGGPTFSVGRIMGGTSINIVPDECLIEIERRVIPGEDPSQVIPHVTAYLQERLDIEFEMSPSWLDGATLSDKNNGPWADRLLQHIEAVAGPRQKQGAWYGTNASRFSAPGVPAIVCGPGSIAQAHTVDEWIETEQLYLASEIYYRFCTR